MKTSYFEAWWVDKVKAEKKRLLVRAYLPTDQLRHRPFTN
jgi:hypothetical protein